MDQPSSSSSSNPQSIPSPSNWEHDVFLSFRGEDTRNSFTDHLYYALNQKGIGAFRDTEKLQRGKSISPELLKAIEESKFAVVVLSTNYATSSWCLDELVHIVECKKLMGLEVLPVFYHVEPSEIRKQTGNYGQAFAKHETNFEDNLRKVEDWREALEDIAGLSGWHVTQDRRESEVIQEIVNQILNVLNNMLSVPERELVGMDTRIMEIESRLDLESNDVLTIGIWGMGGIGKTTLAKEVFKKIRNRFHPSGFVSHVRLQSEVELQRRLCESFLGDGNINIDTVEKGIKLLKKLLLKKKVLIVLDDVDNFKQIECLAPGGPLGENIWGGGSRLIITTRDRSSLRDFSVQETKIYEVEKLRDEEAIQLLCQKAFKKDNPPEEFEALSNSFLQYASGLPLAHEVLGSYLSRLNVDEWSEILHRLDDDQDKDIFSVLQISFDGLQGTDKRIFLDIACFFNGEDHVRVKNILKGCGFSSRIGIRNLIDKSLIKIERNKLWMHDLLQCLGWHIVRGESFFPGKRSRLWLDYKAHKYEGRSSWRFEDARNVLMENTGTASVEGLFLSLPEKEEMSLEDDPFLTMCNLRLLKIYNVNFLDVLFRCVSKNLRLMEWHECPLESLPTNFKSEKLVEIRMPNSRIKQLWNGRLSLGMLIRMDLSHCRYLVMTPDFSTVPNLERLILEGCTDLSEVHPTIGDLQQLDLLNLKDCASLESLPDLISLRSLQTFILSGCSKLKQFPEILGNMDALSKLYLDGTAIQELPVSIQRLKGLVLLNLSGCRNLLSLPSILCISLTSLKFLYLSLCSSIDNLPDNIGHLEHLEELDACNTAIRKVPESTLLLKNLKLLCFHGCAGSTGLELPNTLSGLRSLTTLNLGGCNLAQGAIPDDIGDLKSLQSLDLSENNFFTIPDSISKLSELTEISLFKCNKLRSLSKDVPPSLRNVNVRGCPMLTNSSSNWRRYPPQKSLSIINCRKPDEEKDAIFPELYKFCVGNLEELDLSYCQHLKKIPDLNEVPNLKILNLKGCEKLSEVHPTMVRLQRLILLNLKGCVNLESLPCSISLKSLKKLVLSGCSKLKEFPNIDGDMDHLSELHLDGTAIEYLAVWKNHLKCPLSLNLSGCRNLLTVPVLSSLKTLNLSGCKRIKKLPDDPEWMEHLEELDASETSIKQVHKSHTFLEKVQVLSFCGCKGLQLPKWFSYLNSLTSLNLRRCGLAVDVLDILYGLSSLKILDLGENSFVTIPNSIGRLSRLHRLELGGNIIESIPPEVGQLSSLKVLDLTGNKFVSLPREIGHLTSLEVLNLSENEFARLPESISDLSRLTVLRLFRCSNLQSLPHNLPEHVYVQECPMLKYNADTLTIRVFGEGVCFMHCEKQDDDQPTHVPIPVPKDRIELPELPFPIYIENRVYAKKPFEIRFPHGARIPKLWSHWRSGPFVSIPLSDGNSLCMGFALFVVFEILEGNIVLISELEETICEFYADNDRKSCLVFQNFIDFMTGSYALCCYEPRGGKCRGIFDKSCSQLQALVSTKRADLKVRGCGIHLISEEDAVEFVTSLANLIRQHLDTNFDQHCENILEDETTTGDVMELDSISAFNEDSSSRRNFDIQAREELLILYEGHNGREKSFYLGFPAPIISFPPWFSNHHAGDVTICQLTGNLLDETWVGLELYVVFTRRASASSNGDRSFSFHVDFCVHDHESIVSNGSLKLESFLGTSDQLVVLHLPRVYFPKRPYQCQGISAVFRSIDPEMEVQVCGSRLLFERDLQDLICSLTAAVGTLGEQDVLAQSCSSAHICMVEDSMDEAQAIDGRRNNKREIEKKKGNVETVDQGSKVEGPVAISFSFPFERSTIQVLPEQAPTSSITRLQNYRGYFQKNQGSFEFDILLHSRGRLLEYRDINLEYVAEEDTASLLNCHHLCVMVETLVYGTYISVEWKRCLELLLQYSKAASISNNGHTLPAFKHFKPSSTYNICLPQDKIPGWFTSGPYRNCSKVEMSIPPKLCDDKQWMGIVTCAFFTVDDQHRLARTVKLLCHLRSKDYCLNPIPMCSITRANLLEPLYGGFIWVTYIPRVFLTEFNVISDVKARIYSNCPILRPTLCGVRLLYKQEEEEFRKVITGCCTSFFDKLSVNKHFEGHFKAATQQLDTNFDQHCMNILEDETTTGDLMELGSTSTFNEDGSSRRNLNIQAREEFLINYEGRNAREKSFYLASPAPIISFPPLFSNHHAGDVTLCQLTGNLLDETWVGLELYVVITRRSSASRVGAESFSFYVDFCGHDHASIISNGSLELDSFLGTSDHQLVILHLPRVCFQQRLDQCRGISALFRPIDEEIQVQVCGSRFLFERDLQDLIHTLEAAAGTFVRKHVQVLPEQAPTSSIIRLQKYNCYFQQNQGSVEFNMIHHYRDRLLENRDSNQEYVAEEVTASLLNRHHLNVMVETSVYGTYTSLEWERVVELLLQYSKSATISNNGHGLPSFKHYDPSSTYNICLPRYELRLSGFNVPAGVPMWIPPKLCDDNDWRGLVIFAYVTVKGKHPLSPVVKLMCHLRSKDYCLNPIPMCSFSRVKLLEPLYRSGFIWVTYIPRVFLTEFNMIGRVEARIYSDCPILEATECSIRLLHRYDEELFKRNITERCTSFFDRFHLLRQPLQAEWDGKHFEGHVKKFDRNSIYNATAPFENIPNWFRDLVTWQYEFAPLRLRLPAPDKNWVGLALCAKYLPAPDKNWVGNASFDFSCELKTKTNDYDVMWSSLHEYRMSSEESKRAGSIWLSYLPRSWFMHQLQGKSFIEARWRTSSARMGTHRFVYEHDVEEFKQLCIDLHR